VGHQPLVCRQHNRAVKRNTRNQDCAPIHGVLPSEVNR
jgi:hypothetical protein